MAKDVIAWTPETKLQATERVNEITNIVNKELKTIDKGYITIAPLINEVYTKELFILAGYSNMDKYCKAEFNMSHGTQCGLRKVYNRYLDEKTGDIGEKYKEYGYTKLLAIMDAEKDFESVGINPFEEFKPDMTLREMKETLSLKLEEKKKSDENAIDTSATEVEKKKENGAPENGAPENGAPENGAPENGAPEDSATNEARKAVFNDILNTLKSDIEDMRDYLKDDINEVKTCADTIKGQIATLEKTYNKAHATATVKDTKKNK